MLGKRSTTKLYPSTYNLNLDPLGLHLPGSWDYRCEPLVPGWCAFYVENLLFITDAFIMDFMMEYTERCLSFLVDSCPSLSTLSHL
jgi:hypothetical protein